MNEIRDQAQSATTMERNGNAPAREARAEDGSEAKKAMDRKPFEPPKLTVYGELPAVTGMSPGFSVQTIQMAPDPERVG